MEQVGIDFSGGFSMTSMIVLIVFAATLLTIFAMALPFMRGERFEGRLRAVRERRRQLHQSQTQSFQARARLQAVPNKGIKGLALRGVSMQDLLDAKELRAKLARAGKRGPSAVANYLFTRIATPIILAAGVYKLPDLLGTNGDGIRGQILVGSIVAGIAAYLSVRFLTRFFRTRTLTPFAIYCLVFGAISIIHFG